MRKLFLASFLCYIFILTGTFGLYAQSSIFKFEHVTTEQGLSSNRINAMVQDQSGFLWIATNNGLNRFDGLENKQYTKQVDDTCALSTNTILAEYCDSHDQLWILTVNFLHRYNKKNDSFERYWLSDKKESSRYGNKGVITEDTEGTIWIGTPTNGLFALYNSSHNCQSLLPQVKSVSSLHVDNSGSIWIGGEFGQLANYDPQTKRLKQYKVPDELRRNLTEDFIWNIWQDHSGKINLLLASGLFQFDQQKEQFFALTDWNKKVNFSSNALRSVLVEQNVLWIGTQGGGLYILNFVTGKVAQYQSIYNNPGSLSNNSITSILKDHCGVYWIGTNDGINKYDPATQLFSHYQKDPENPNSLQYNFVSSFCESPDGNIWIGTFGQGISVYNRMKESFHTITSSPGNINSLIDNTIRALEPDKSGHIWIGTTNGLSRYNLKTKDFKNYRKTNDKGSISSDNILSLLVTKDNRLLIGSNGEGLSYCRIDHLAEEGFQTYDSKFDFVCKAKMRKMIELNNGVIVCGSMGNGVTFLDGGKAVNILPSVYSKSIDSDYVNALCEDSEHNIWIGTWDGLFLMNSDWQLIKQFNPKNGIPSNEITGILADAKGDIWAVGMNGLSHLSRITGSEYKIINYTCHDGLQGSYFTTYSTLKTADGELFFAGYNGFNRFFPDRIKSDPMIPKVVLTDFLVFNQPVPIGKKVNGQIPLSRNISETKSIVLNNEQKVIGFRFTALKTSQIEKVKFACLMKGIDPDWVFLDYNQRYKSYNNLPSGEYTFTVRACNAAGVWDPEGTSISIKVLPPPWKSWWAYLLYALIITGFLYLAREYSLSKARLQNNALLERVHREKDAEINNLKIKFFINISHEIRTPLSLILAPLEKLVRSAEPSPEMKRNLEIMHGNALRLFNLINQLLDFRKIETGNVHLNLARYDVVAFIQEIRKAFAENAHLKNIELTVDSNVKMLLLWIDPNSFEKIMFNLLSNALKFTPAGGKVRIIVNQLQDEKCEIIVRDNGIGVASDKLEKLFDRFYQVDSKSFLKHDSIGSGIGLSIVKNLVELHKGEITVESVYGEYTLFRLLFLTGKSHLENVDNITLSEDPAPFALNLRNSVPIIEGMESAEIQAVQESKYKIRVLIVEDNPEIRYYLKQSLHANYEVIEAPNGKSGYKQALHYIPDLVITDVMMPEMDGIELCRVLKNELLTQHIPIIILSAKSTIEDTLEGLETGADDYVPKPFNEQLLLAKIKTLLANRQKIIEKYQHQQYKESKNEAIESLHFDDPFVERVVDYIQASLSDEALSNEKIEMHFKTNKMQLYRKLKAVTGWSVNTLIREIKIREATRLLKESEMNISEIAYKLGFSDPLYFSKYFKKEVGVAPQQYRKDH
jgi:signal transduction histidine kinase/ligand-binding sensor domain-containing protein/DNA-binding response OmpR family regulator